MGCTDNHTWLARMFRVLGWIVCSHVGHSVLASYASTLYQYSVLAYDAGQHNVLTCWARLSASMLHVQTCWAYDVGQDDAGQHNVLTCWAYDALLDDAGQHKVLSYFSQLVPQVGRLIIGWECGCEDLVLVERRGFGYEVVRLHAEPRPTHTASGVIKSGY